MRDLEEIDIFDDASEDELMPDEILDPTPIHRHSNRKEIDISDARNLNEILMELLRAVGDVVYNVDGKLVDIQKIDGKYLIVDLSETEMLNYLSKKCDFYRLKKRKGGEIREYTNTPTVLQMKHVIRSTRIIQKQVRELTGITHAPVLLESGEVLKERGYHEESGLFVVNTCKVQIKEEPTLKDAQAAAVQFISIFQDYPFDTPEDRWLYLTAHLTAAGRRALGTAPVPGTFINAHDRGAGKSALTESIPNVSFQGNSARSGWPGQSELEKRITAWGLSKPEAVVFDNIKVHMGGASIEDSITSAKFGGRVLGKTQGASGRFLSYLIVNANDGHMSEDLARRFIHVHLTKQRKRGDEYAMTDTTPDEYCRKNNETMKAHLITILLAFMRHGTPDTSKRLASFEAWSDLCLAAAQWVAPEDIDDLSKVQSNRENTLRNEESGCEDELIVMFHEFANDDWKCLKDILTVSNESYESMTPPPTQALAKAIVVALKADGHATGKAFGHALKRYRNNTFQIGDNHYKVESKKIGGYMRFKTVQVAEKM